MISLEEAQKAGFGPYPVTIVNHYLIPLPCGEHVAAKFWIPSLNLSGYGFDGIPQVSFFKPSDAHDWLADGARKFPVIMEYLPYRKADFTYCRDYRRHPWFASHGYVCVRVDLRGAGDSEGLYYDEYLAQELEDACDLIRWFEQQPWCTGRVGMYGKSWGGFNGLQVAHLQPPALKAVVSLYSTDDRYETDAHYEGGCVLASQMLGWASYMFSMINPLPPDPRNVPNWKTRWLERLERSGQSWIQTWLSHQLRDKYWLHGSICTDPGRVTVPVLAIGGWRDGYTDAVFRMLTTLPCIRGIVGPWSHEWPDVGRPGPALDYLVECLKWWDCHLKQKPNGAMDAPLLRVYLRDSVPPSQACQSTGTWPGHWALLHQWPPVGQKTWMYVPHRGLLLHATDELSPLSEESVTAYFKSTSGAWCGEWFGVSVPDAPADQHLEDALSLTWTSNELAADLGILGFPELACTVRVAANRSQLTARLCDVFPDGRSTLISYGVLNLTHHKGHGPGQIEDLVPQRTYDVKLKLHSTSYTVPEGHRIRLAVSPNYWPLIWPAPIAANFDVLTGHKGNQSEFFSSLILPLCSAQALDDPHFSCKYPQIGPKPAIQMQAEPCFDLSTGISISSGVLTRQILDDSGRIFLKDAGIIWHTKEKKRYTMAEGEPLSAKAESHLNLDMEWPDVGDGTKISIETHSEMTGDERNFYLVSRMEAGMKGEILFQKTWEETVERQSL